MKSYEEILKQIESESENQNARGGPSFLQNLIQQGLKLNDTNKEGWTLLTLALKMKLEKAAKILINAQACLNLGNHKGETPLYWASFQGITEIIQIIVASKGDVNAVTKTGISPLIAAIANNKEDVAKLLIEANANVARACSKGNSALHWAAGNGLVNTLSFLLSKGGKAIINIKNKEGLTAFTMALFYKKTSTAVLLLNKGAQVNVDDFNGEKSFVYACQFISSYEWNHKEVEIIFEHIFRSVKQINPNHKQFGSPILSDALQFHFPEIVSKLMALGVNINEPDAFGRPPIFYAFRESQRRAILEMMNAGATLNLCLHPLFVKQIPNNNLTTLQLHVINDGITSLKPLMHNQLDSNPLCTAFEEDGMHYHSALFLIEAGVDLYTKSPLGLIDSKLNDRRLCSSLPGMPARLIPIKYKIVDTMMIAPCLKSGYLRAISNKIEYEYLKNLYNREFLEKKHTHKALGERTGIGLVYPGNPGKIILEYAGLNKPCTTYDLTLKRDPKLLKDIADTYLQLCTQDIFEKHYNEIYHELIIKQSMYNPQNPMNEDEIKAKLLALSNVLAETLITRYELYHQNRRPRFFASYINTIFQELVPAKYEPSKHEYSKLEPPKNTCCDVPKPLPITSEQQTKDSEQQPKESEKQSKPPEQQQQQPQILQRLPRDLDLLILEYCDTAEGNPIPEKLPKEYREEAYLRKVEGFDCPGAVARHADRFAGAPYPFTQKRVDALESKLLKLRFKEIRSRYNRYEAMMQLSNNQLNKEAAPILPGLSLHSSSHPKTNPDPQSSSDNGHSTDNALLQQAELANLTSFSLLQKFTNDVYNTLSGP